MKKLLLMLTFSCICFVKINAQHPDCEEKKFHFTPIMANFYKSPDMDMSAGVWTKIQKISIGTFGGLKFYRTDVFTKEKNGDIKKNYKDHTTPLATLMLGFQLVNFGSYDNGARLLLLPYAAVGDSYYEAGSKINVFIANQIGFGITVNTNTHHSVYVGGGLMVVL